MNEYTTAAETDPLALGAQERIGVAEVSRFRQALLHNVLRGFGAGLIVGLILSLAVSMFTQFQPAAITSLMSIFTAGFYGAYLGMIYGSQPGDNAPTLESR